MTTAISTQALSSSHRVFSIGDSSDVGVVRRAVGGIAAHFGATESEREPAQIVVTELGTNIWRHAGAEGAIFLRVIDGENVNSGLEILAVDRGKGMVYQPRTMVDIRTDDRNVRSDYLNGLGVGLLSVERLSDTFDVYSRPNQGTAVVSRISWKAATSIVRKQDDTALLSWGGIATPMFANEKVGDGWDVLRSSPEVATVLVVDGLGHGPGAHDASQRAIEVFREFGNLEVEACLEKIHRQIQGTRGGVALVARVDKKAETLRYVSVGNISGKLFDSSGESLRVLVSQPGIVGTEQRLPTLRSNELPWSEDASLVLWSDGVSSRLSLELHPQLLRHDPTLVAAVLHRDFGKTHDDTTVVVLGDRRTAPR